jgi:hypothetical protein
MPCHDGMHGGQSCNLKFVCREVCGCIALQLDWVRGVRGASSCGCIVTSSDTRFVFLRGAVAAGVLVARVGGGEGV